MKKYVIEREIPGIGSSTHEQFAAATAKSCNAIRSINNSVQWIHSYVAGDKTYCVYLAENPEAIKEHAARSGFPANNIQEIKAMIDPTTA